jgi:hypothetical protein
MVLPQLGQTHQGREQYAENKEDGEQHPDPADRRPLP